MHNMGWWCLGFILVVSIYKSERASSKDLASIGKRSTYRKRDRLEYATNDEVDELHSRIDDIEERLG